MLVISCSLSDDQLGALSDQQFDSDPRRRIFGPSVTTTDEDSEPDSKLEALYILKPLSGRTCFHEWIVFQELQ